MLTALSSLPTSAVTYVLSGVFLILYCIEYPVMGRPVGRVGAVQDTLIPTCPDSGLAITLVGAEASLATVYRINKYFYHLYIRIYNIYAFCLVYIYVYSYVLYIAVIYIIDPPIVF